MTLLGSFGKKSVKDAIPGKVNAPGKVDVDSNVIEDRNISKEDVLFLLKIIVNADLNIKGSELQKVVLTIDRLQKLLK